MAKVSNLTGSGIAGGAAQSVVGYVSLAQTASGATQGAQTAVSDIVQYTVSTADYGPTLSATAAPGDTVTVVNGSANTIKVWPAVGYKINNGSANAALSIATLVTAQFISLGDGNWVAIKSA
jgi:hypothetical protein